MLSNVTLAILSGPEPPLQACVDSAHAQEGGPYSILRIHNVAPMSAAFNAMIAQATTPYVVQIDGDVILKPWATRVLVTTLRNSLWRYASWGQLYESGFGLGGAVRCWRRRWLRAVPFRDVRCVDRDLNRRMHWLGLRRIQSMAPEPFGIHEPRMTPFARYSKAKSDLKKWRFLGREDLIWDNLPSYESDEHLMTGALVGLIQQDIQHSKNASVDWQEFQSIWGNR